MSFKRMLGISCVISLGVWAWCSWPLPRYAASGIPAAAQRAPAELQPMRPGDHLQYLYYCRLAQDMVSGQTPLFYNLYEFYTGADRDCFQPDTYYFPFSLLYAIGAWIGGMAFGWNLTGFLSLWGTCLLTWLLARRYTDNDWIAAAASVAALALPFRWINLCGGSPAGFAMMWIPALWLGLDLAVRDTSIRGGVLAGLAILFARWTDQHVFFFGALTIPAWSLLALITRGAPQVSRTDSGGTRRTPWPRIGRALLPTALLAALALLLPLGFQGLAWLVKGVPAAAAVISRRSLQEVTLYSPVWQGLFSRQELGMSSHIYIGYAALVISAAGGLILLGRSIREWKLHGRSLVLLALIGAGILGIILLALGTRGPEHGALFKLCRALVPPYGMVRQPAKIFCLMPSFLAVALTLALAALTAVLKQRTWRILIPALAGLFLAVEYGTRIHPVISLLDRRQDAYAAVAEDIRAETVPVPTDQDKPPSTGPEPKRVKPKASHSSPTAILVLPLWPGDSHYASVYQHFALLYRLRMVNGYSPVVSQEYFDHVFRGLESANQGWLTEAQLEQLQRMNVGYILLHEDLFPEKVSPFPVTFTLKQLLAHPRLRLLKQDGPVWAFKILPPPRRFRDVPLAGEDEKTVPAWEFIGSARRWEVESSLGAGGSAVTDAATGGTGYVALRHPGAWVGIRPANVSRAPGLKWMIRIRGKGVLRVILTTNDRMALVCFHEVNAPDWIWLNFPVPLPEGFGAVALKLELQRGMVDIDTCLLAAGSWNSPAPGQSLKIPAPCFFHAGYINLEQDSVVLRKDRDPDALDFYGMKLPFESGRYQVEFICRTAAAPDTLLGQFNIRRRDSDPVEWTAVKAGHSADAVFTQDQNLPFHLEFRFLRNADMEIQQVIFTRLD